MYSPASRTLRQTMLRHVLLESDTSSNTAYPPELHDELAISDPMDLETLEQETFYELKDLEEHFDMYMSVQYKPSLIAFNPDFDLQRISPQEPLSILSTLAPAHESRYMLYKLQGLQSLLPELNMVECSHPGLVAQRDDLISIINLEIKAILQGLWDERLRLQISARSSGARTIEIDDHTISPFISPIVTSAMLLTAVMHAIMGVGRAHCNLILRSLRAIVTMTANTVASSFAGENPIQQDIDDIPTTLPTVLHRLNLLPKFVLYAVCEECSALYPLSTELELPATCTNIKDGICCGTILSTTHRRGTRTWQKPIRRYSHMRFESWISEMLLRPGVEDLLENARPNPNPGPVAEDVWDAPYVHTFPSLEDSNFMSNIPPGELRLLMILYHDFFNPFENKTGKKVRSIGCLFMSCLNLPPDVRYNAANAYLVSVIPGPHETKLDDLHHFMTPIVDDMEELYTSGIWVPRTHKYPQGRKVRAAIVVKSMDIPAARGAGGFASHSHTHFCHLCNALLSQIDHPNLLPFILRDIETHRQQVKQWELAQTPSERKKIYDLFGVRSSPWLRFSWWNPFETIIVAPMHWTKNIIDKHLRRNMNWSWTLPAGMPQFDLQALPPISVTEYEWGTRALLCLDANEFRNTKLPASLVRYLCRERGIFESGLAAQSRLINDLHRWRITDGIIFEDGSLTPKGIDQRSNGDPVSVARAVHYITKQKTTVNQVTANSSVEDLIHICTACNLATNGTKSELAKRLITHYANIRIPMKDGTSTSTSHSASGNPKPSVSLLGCEVLTEIRADMKRTFLPSWLKNPPPGFATLDHGSIQSEEYKSLVLVSFTITLVRLWGNEVGVLRDILDNFLHLMLVIRILAFQSLTEMDILAFELHYQTYLEQLKELYPSASFIPVQHLGLHIPHFLRALGPSTRVSESTCEQYIQMFQNISTNFKFGDLELTLHREFVMMSRLKGLIEDRRITESLGEFGKVIEDFLRQYVPSQASQVPTSWETAHPPNPTRLPDLVFDLLASWTNDQQIPSYPQSMFLCSSIRLGNLKYCPYDSATGDGCILFSLPHDQNQVLAGRIDYILEEPLQTPSKGRIALIVRAFCPLTVQDLNFDPYDNHPIVGRNGAGLAKLYYDRLEEQTHLIEPKDLVSHIAVCTYEDRTGKLSCGCVVVLSLDLKHKRFE